MNYIKELKDQRFEDIVKGLVNTCCPYGSESYDEERHNILTKKILIVESLINEIVEAGEYHDRKEHSILMISKTANKYLAELRNYLNDIDYLPKEEE